jgi:hypothetical protein
VAPTFRHLQQAAKVCAILVEGSSWLPSRSAIENVPRSRRAGAAVLQVVVVVISAGGLLEVDRVEECSMGISCSEPWAATVLLRRVRRVMCGTGRAMAKTHHQVGCRRQSSRTVGVTDCWRRAGGCVDPSRLAQMTVAAPEHYSGQRRNGAGDYIQYAGSKLPDRPCRAVVCSSAPMPRRLQPAQGIGFSPRCAAAGSSPLAFSSASCVAQGRPAPQQLLDAIAARKALSPPPNRRSGLERLYCSRARTLRIHHP